MLGHRLPSATSNPHRTAPLRLCSWKPDRCRWRLPSVSTILISIHDPADSSMHAPIVLIQGLAFFCFQSRFSFASTSQAIFPKPSAARIWLGLRTWCAYRRDVVFRLFRVVEAFASTQLRGKSGFELSSSPTVSGTTTRGVDLSCGVMGTMERKEDRDLRIG